MSALSTSAWFVIFGRPTAPHIGPTERPTPSVNRSPLSACRVIAMPGQHQRVTEQEVGDAGGDPDVRRRLRDGPAEHAEVLRAVPLTDPDRAEAEVLGHLRLTDGHRRIGDAAGQGVGAEARKIGGAHPTSLTHVSEAVPTRDPVETAETLERWLRGRLDAESVTVSDLKVPKAGFSNETIVADVAWSDAAGKHDRAVVVRIEPTAHQLFVEPDALRQAQVMSTLAGHVPVPPIWLTEDDPEVLGAPFFLMERVDGRIPGDVP